MTRTVDRCPEKRPENGVVSSVRYSTPLSIDYQLKLDGVKENRAISRLKRNQSGSKRRYHQGTLASGLQDVEAHLSLRIRARGYREIPHLQRLVRAAEVPPLGGHGVLALEVVPAPAEPPVLEVYHGLADQLVRAETVVVVKLAKGGGVPVTVYPLFAFPQKSFVIIRFRDTG